MEKVVTLVELAERGHISELRQLLDTGSDVNARDPDGRVALHAALAGAELEIVRLLVERGADPRAVDSKGLGTLHWAACANSRGMLDIARDLSGEAVDVVDLEGRTPLSWAAQSNDSVTIEWLLENGADPNRVDRDGWGPLHYAAADGNADALRQLLAAGALALQRLPSGHLASDLARGFSPHKPEATILLAAAESRAVNGGTFPS